MRFHKWNGLGNDFIIIPPGEGGTADLARLAPAWCDRHRGIGADGIVTLEELGGGAFRMRIFNSDGSEAGMCGNATRCVALFLQRLYGMNNCELHTRSTVVKPRVVAAGKVEVDMWLPRFRRGEIPVAGDADAEARELELETVSGTFAAFAVSMGNPHAVVFVGDAENFPVSAVGPRLEKHPLFPDRCNIEFAQIVDRRTIRMRVWERGCGITLACGTGSCATAVAAVERGLVEPEVTLILDGGSLDIAYTPGGHVFMTGPATEVFHGEIQEITDHE